MILDFPPKLMMAPSWTPPHLVGMVQSAGRSASGIYNASRSDGGGLWKVSMGEALFKDYDCIRSLDALKAILAEGVVPIIVPFRRLRTQPWPTVDGSLLTSYGPIPHSDDTLHSDGTGYYQEVIDVQLAEAAELRDTTLELTINLAGELMGGEVFSIPHDDLSHRPYRIIGIQDQDATSATVTITPPLREDTAAGTYLNFDLPKCIMQLDGPDGFNFSMAERTRVASASLRFIESFLPLE